MSQDPDRPVRAGRPAQLSREQIIEAVCAAENVDTLTMRQLATQLGVQHGALYRWVKNRDELFDLVSSAMVERVLAADRPGKSWRTRLKSIAWAMHDNFGSVRGYATHLSRPHDHNAHSTHQLRALLVDVFLSAGVSTELAEESWYIFITSVVSWLAFQEQTSNLAPARFEPFLGVLVRGLPARETSPKD